MDETKREWIRSWLVKARSDLRTAQLLAAADDPPTDTAIYHCQQAAEKALKAYLAFRDQTLQRTHDLEKLPEAAVAVESGFAALVDQTEILNPYSSAFRYPGLADTLFPPAAEPDSALEHPQAISDFVLGYLPNGVHPL